MYNIYNKPSFYAHIINGLFLFVAFVLLFKKFSQIKRLEPYKIILLTLIFSLAIGVHGLSHLGLETNYNYNSMKNI